MKKIYSTLIMLGFIAATFASCQKEEPVQETRSVLEIFFGQSDINEPYDFGITETPVRISAQEAPTFSCDISNRPIRGITIYHAIDNVISEPHIDFYDDMNILKGSGQSDFLRFKISEDNTKLEVTVISPNTTGSVRDMRFIVYGDPSDKTKFDYAHASLRIIQEPAAE